MANDYHVAELNGETCFNAEADADRIVACVNAMAGVPDPEKLMAAVRRLAEAYKQSYDIDTMFQVSKAVVDIAAALKGESDA